MPATSGMTRCRPCRHAARWGLLYAALAAAPALASQPADPAAPPAGLAETPPDGPIAITITAFNGSVQARQAPEDAWKPVAVGDVYAEGFELRTGVRSAVKFRIPPDSDITVDRLGVVKVLRAAVEGGTIKTDVGMKYGRTRYDVEAAGRKHDAQIRTPSSVLAIRGTDVVLEDTPGFAPRAVSFTGRARLTDARGQSSNFGTPGDAGQSRPPVENSTDQGSAAETAIQTALPNNNSVIASARTPSENLVIASIPGTGAAVPGTVQPGATREPGGTAPPPPPIIPPPPPIDLLPGRLEVVLSWAGNADLQVGVVSPLGEPLTTNPVSVTGTPPRQQFPIGTTAPLSGGQAGPDDTGSSGAGRETIVWSNGFPPGRYDYGVKYNTGSAPADYKLDILVNGIPLEPGESGRLTGPSADEFEGNAIEITATPSAPTQQPAIPSGRKRRK